MITLTKHGLFKVDPRDEFIGRKLIETGEYQPEELAFLSQHVTPESNVLIVGAHIGAFAIPLSRLCGSLIAVEANPHTYNLLVDNVALNRCANIDTREFAASDTDGEALTFLCGTANSGGSKRLPVRQRADYVYDDPEMVTVFTRTLDSLFGALPFSLVHMDIEGSEVFALRGAQRVLSHTQFLSVEFISHHLTHVAGVTVEEWLEPIRPHFNMMAVPGSTERKRPHIFLEPEDWHEMLQNIVDSGAGVEGLMFWRK